MNTELMEPFCNRCEELQSALKVLRADRDRLREALRYIRDQSDNTLWIRNHVSAALAASGGEVVKS